MLFISFHGLRIIDKSFNNSISSTGSELFFEFLILVFERFELLFDLLENSVKAVPQTDEFTDDLIGSGIVLPHDAFEEREECLDLFNDVGFLFVSIHGILALLVKWEGDVGNVGRFVMGLMSGVLAEPGGGNTRS